MAWCQVIYLAEAYHKVCEDQKDTTLGHTSEFELLILRSLDMDPNAEIETKGGKRTTMPARLRLKYFGIAFVSPPSSYVMSNKQFDTLHSLLFSNLFLKSLK